jgi:hypothetical protein
MGDVTGSKAKKLAKKNAKNQQRELDSQRQDEERKSAESEDEAGRRKLIAKGGGTRSSLLAGSEKGATGKATQLGG